MMVARMLWADWPFAFRSSNESKTEKIAPWFEASVNVAPSKPAKAAVEKTPGIDVRISLTFRVTSSVRANEEPGGSCRTVMR